MTIRVDKGNKIKIKDIVVTGNKELKAGKKINPWMEHVKEFKKSNPGLKYSEVLKNAKATYKK